MKSRFERGEIMNFPYPWKTTEFVDGCYYKCVFDKRKYGRRRWLIEAEIVTVQIIKRTSKTVLVTDGRNQWRMRVRHYWGYEIAYRHNVPFMVWCSANKTTTS